VSPSLEHRFSQLVAFATFVLLVIGGTVNPTGSSLACPEPTFTCHGELFPPMTGGVLYEHGHRLAAMTVGLLQLALTALMLARGTRRRLAVLLFVMVSVQGLLGALTVKYLLPWYVSTAHLVLAMSYFGTLIYTAFLTLPAPTVKELEQHDRRRAELGGARRWIVAAVLVVFVQLVIGALVRHLGAAMVCLGMPSCTLGGEYWPDAPVQQLHMLHRAFGVVVALVTTIAAVQVWRAAKSWSGLRALALVAPVLVLAQLALGIYTVMTMRSVPVAVGHFAGASALWALWLGALLITRSRTKKLAVDAAPGLRRMVTK
jgi:cytochrome c oxidase assembly protein subunit 15